jgi:uncharacterized protein affecting Mg2+/Co2+ transport
MTDPVQLKPNWLNEPTIKEEQEKKIYTYVIKVKNSTQEEKLVTVEFKELKTLPS